MSSDVDDGTRAGASTRGRPLAIAYAAKRPPSPSAVAMYAGTFVDVLSTIGPVDWVPVAADPRATQTLRASVRGFLQGRRLAGRADLAHVELSGRALFEFYLCVGLLSRRRRSAKLVVTLHDVPSVVGASMLFGFLDRRGFRRLGMWLTSTFGTRLERRILRRSDAVFALTRTGATFLRDAYDRDVVALPHVVAPLTAHSTPDSPERRDLFIPGYVDDAETIAALAMVADRESERSGLAWQLRVGACPPDVPDDVRRRLPTRAWGRVVFLGFLDEATLLAEFTAAALVVRVVNGGASNSMAASSPLSWAMAAGAAVVTNDRRAGARELAEQRAIVQCDDVVEAVSSLIGSGNRIEALRARARDASRSMSVDAVGALYRSALFG